MKKSVLKLSCIFTLSVLAIGSAFFRHIPEPDLKEHKILLSMSSFKRPIFLVGQIARLLNQTYKNHDISVSIKGSPNEAAYRNTFLREIENYEKTGRVFIRFDKNRDQFYNFLDTVRNIDIEQYDIICKIDDDDWYAPDYVYEVNKAFNQIPEEDREISSTSYSHAYILTEDIDQTHLRKNNSNLTGPTLCFSKEIIKIALQIEQDPTIISKYVSGHSSGSFWRNEDALLDHLARANGPHIERDSPYTTVIYGQQYRSVMRNNQYVR